MRGIALMAALTAALSCCFAACVPAPGAAAFESEDCAGLGGANFAADHLALTGIRDPSLGTDLDELGDELDLGFDEAGGFSSSFTPAGANVIETTGTVDFTADTATFSAPFLPGFEAGGVDFECDFDSETDTLILMGDGDFDLDEDGYAEPAFLEGTFTLAL